LRGHARALSKIGSSAIARHKVTGSPLAQLSPRCHSQQRVRALHSVPTHTETCYPQ
jgi:hypothetical protein